MDEIKKLKKLNQIAKCHDYTAGFNGVMTRYRRRCLLTAIETNCKNRDAVLDVGAGSGEMLSLLLDCFDSILALEPATFHHYELERIFGNIKSGTYTGGTFEQFVGEPKSFSAIMFMGVLEHMENPLRNLSLAHDLLTDDGFVIASVPNAYSVHRQAGREMGLIRSETDLTEADDAVGHWRVYSDTLLKSHFKKAGFEVCGIEGIMLKPFPDAMMRVLNEGMWEAFYQIGSRIPEYCAELLIVAKKEKR